MHSFLSVPPFVRLRPAAGPGVALSCRSFSPPPGFEPNPPTRRPRRPPAPRRPDAPAMVEIPFDFSQGVIILDVDYGGTRPAKVALDTGDADSLLDHRRRPRHRSSAGHEGPQGWRQRGGRGDVLTRPMRPARDWVRRSFPGKGLIVMPVAKNLLEDSGIRCEGTLGYEFLQRPGGADRLSRAGNCACSPPLRSGDIKGATEGADLPIQWQSIPCAEPAAHHHRPAPHRRSQRSGRRSTRVLPITLILVHDQAAVAGQQPDAPRWKRCATRRRRSSPRIF